MLACIFQGGDHKCLLYLEDSGNKNKDKDRDKIRSEAVVVKQGGKTIVKSFER